MMLMLQSYGVTRSSAISGSWSSAITWIPAGVPACGDSIIIQAIHIVSVTSNQNYNSCGTSMKIIVNGRFHFVNGSKLQLNCGSYVMVRPGGTITSDSGNGNSNSISICNNTEWNSNAILIGPACLPSNAPPCQGGILPVQLLNFKGVVCEQSQICFGWESATERNNSHYELQKSRNAIDFTSFAVIQSQAPSGNSSYKLRYEGVDKEPQPGLTYYRLKQIDRDQTISYSEVISINNLQTGTLEIAVFPNSNNGEFTAQIFGNISHHQTAVVMRNHLGSIVFQALYFIEPSDLSINVKPHNKLAAGIYYCSFFINGTEHVVKVLVGNF
jgi:hypothetical protein